MIRTFWHEKIVSEFQKFNVIWLSGVRRVGKTTLCRSLDEKLFYLDCEIPKNRRLLEDPDLFFAEHDNRLIVLDEIHRLNNPSETLKIAADHFPNCRVIATGSSTLAAKDKFQDTLTDRKSDVFLTPLNFADMKVFGKIDIKKRLLFGGLPKNYTAARLPNRQYKDWIDSYWAKDIQELFRIERRNAFLKLMELLFLQSGGLFEANQLSAPCEISRQTVVNYLNVFEATNVFHVLRPYSSQGTQEIVSMPKVYGFDTGFVTFFKGWNTLRDDDCGLLWEHLVLNELHGYLLRDQIHYWRDKQKREVDFIVTPLRGSSSLAIECKWREQDLKAENLVAFRNIHPHGKNILVAANVSTAHTIERKGLKIRVIGLEHVAKEIQEYVELE